MKDLLRISDLTGDDLTLLLRLAAGFQDDPGSAHDLLAHRIVPMYFAKPSTRTRLSTAAAVTRLGGTPVAVGPDELQLRRGETIGDTARVMGSYAAAIVIPTFADAEDERGRRTEALAPCQVNESLMCRACDDAIFTHCLPAHRGQEVTAAVIDGARSLAFRQAANRLPAAQAVLYALLTRRLEGHR